jgi:glycosyltransferase involved in cell wall biosynthesis
MELKNNKMKVSFIIPVINNFKYTKGIYDNLKEYFPDDEIIIADGGSTDETIEYFESKLKTFEREISKNLYNAADADEKGNKQNAQKLRKTVKDYQINSEIFESALFVLRGNESLSPSEFASDINFEIGHNFVKSQFYNPLGPQFFLLKDLIPSQIPGVAGKDEPEVHTKTAKDFIKKSRKIRKVMGGGMRQAGMLAAACIYALENNVVRLKEDHIHAQHLATALRQNTKVKKAVFQK